MINTVLRLVYVNGLWWFILYVLERMTSGITPFFYNRRIRYETKKKLKGFNSIDYNYKEWRDYDWEGGGEEWTESSDWKDALVTEVMDRFFEDGSVILEIGPGGGRWSKILAERSKRLVLVDLTEKSIEACKVLLRNYDHCLFYKNDGVNLSFIEDSSIDYLWSFDVFVHIAPSDVELYLRACRRILKPGAIGIIHHAIKGTNKEGFRSSLTNEVFNAILNTHNFELVDQITRWGPDEMFGLSSGDVVSVFKKLHGSSL